MIPLHRDRQPVASASVCALVVLASGFGAQRASAEPIFLPSLSGGDALQIIEKENVRRRVDGRYAGYLYRECRGYLRREQATADTYAGSFYLLEDLTSLGSRSKLLETRIDGAVSLGPDGPEHRSGSLYPRIVGFPSIPRKRHEVGDVWRDFGARIVEPRLDGVMTRVDFYCEYEYLGLTEFGGQDAYHIKAQYALRYSGGADPEGDPDLASVSGSHKADILLTADSSGRAFVRTAVDETYRFVGGETIGYQGFLLTWINDLQPFDRAETKREIARSLDSTEGVAVEEHEEGIAIQLQSIHFVADSPEILADERPRLDAIYSAIEGISQDRTFLVIGHTADVGTAESQQLLSIKRALTIIAELVERGISPDRFLHSGRGGTEPVAPNDIEENMAKNRRVEIVILDP